MISDLSCEQDKLSMLVAVFAEKMRQKIHKKMSQGYKGWNAMNNGHGARYLRNSLEEHVRRYLAGDPKQLVDIANLAALLWWNEGMP